MRSLTWPLYLWLVLTQLLGVAAQSTHTVSVGSIGSFYNPPTATAEEGDTIRFIFSAGTHSVTESSLENPCVPLPGGFDSGLIGPGKKSLAPAVSWDIVVSNASEPIWYFCQATTPWSQCAAGMVGAINPPSSETWDSFVSAAKAVSNTPTPTPTFLPSGIGAFASNSPTVVTSFVPLPTLDPSALSSLSALFPTSFSFPLPSSSSASASSTSGSTLGPVLGGIFGALFAIGSVTLLVLLLIRANRRRRAAEARLAGLPARDVEETGNRYAREPMQERRSSRAPFRRT